MINVTKRMIALFVTAIAIILPLVNFAPRLYLWFFQRYVAKLYRRLRLLEVESRTEVASARLLAMQVDLDNIDRAAKVLPMRHSDLFFALRTHIDITRTRLSSLLPPLQCRKAAESLLRLPNSRLLRAATAHPVCARSSASSPIASSACRLPA